MHCDYGLVGIGQAAAHYGVSVVTMRRWEREKRLFPTYRTLGGHRRYRLDGENDRLSVGYARVSGSDQKADLARQKDFLSPHCDDVIGDVGSGLNCNKPGLKKLLNLILNRKIKALHLAYKDRLLRFGQSLIFQCCKWAGVDVIVHKNDEETTFEQTLCHDVMTLMAVFSAKLYGRRSHQKRCGV